METTEPLIQARPHNSHHATAYHLEFIGKITYYQKHEDIVM